MEEKEIDDINDKIKEDYFEFKKNRLEREAAQIKLNKYIMNNKLQFV